MIQLGKYYRDIDGNVGKCISDKANELLVNGWSLDSRGLTHGGELRVVAEVQVTDVLPFPLIAGNQYELDSGEVVTLQDDKHWSGFACSTLMPFAFISSTNATFHVTPHGVALSGDCDNGVTRRIVRPHVPAPPIERLEKWRKDSYIIGHKPLAKLEEETKVRLAELDAIIAAFKAADRPVVKRES